MSKDMKADYQNKTTIKVKGKQLDNLRSGLQKIVEELTKPGLKNNSITITEVEAIEELARIL